MTFIKSRKKGIQFIATNIQYSGGKSPAITANDRNFKKHSALQESSQNQANIAEKNWANQIFSKSQTTGNFKVAHSKNYVKVLNVYSVHHITQRRTILFIILKALEYDTKLHHMFPWK